MKLYGSLNNRFEENKMFCKEIKVGTGMTEYSYSDRHAYEVIAVKDQKHVTVRLYDHKGIGEPMSNQWELISNEENPTMELVKRGNYWYSELTATADMIDHPDWNVRLWVAMNFDIEKLKEKGMQKRYYRRNVSFGVANYYYDYEF